MRTRVSTFLEPARIGLDASRSWFLGNVALALAAPLAVLSIPVAARTFVDGLVSGDDRAITSAIVVFTLGASITWTVTVLEGTLSNGLGTKVEPQLMARIGQAVSSPPSMTHLLNADSLDRLQLVKDTRYELLAGPRAFVAVLRFGLRAIGIIVLLATVQPGLALLALLAPAPFVAQRFAAKIRASAELSRAHDSLLANRSFELATSVGAAGELRIWGLDGGLRAAHADASRRLVRAEMKAALYEALLAGAGWLVFVAGLFVALWIVANGASTGRYGLGDVVLVVLLAQMIGSQVSEGVPLVATLATALAATRRLLEFEDLIAVEPAGRRDAPASIADGIRIEGLSFAYDNAETDALSDVSVTLAAGTCTAVVGANGAGKSTLVQLLAGLQRPGSGCITVDGTDLSDIAPELWRERVTACFQDFVRYTFPVRLNVGVGYLPAADHDPDLLAALGAARADDLVPGLSGGLDCPLSGDGFGGTGLSGGQWQKVAVARGLLSPDPLLILLDEPTASLDAQTESDVFATYLASSKAFAARTGAVCVVTTHRFGMARAADLILVLQDGRLVEVGDHPTLMKLGGAYAELFEVQAAGYR